MIYKSAPRAVADNDSRYPRTAGRKGNVCRTGGRAFAPHTVKSSINRPEEKEKARIARSGPLAIHACKFKRLTFPSGYLATVSEAVVVSVKPPPVPVMVMVWVPVRARRLTVNVRFDAPEPGAAMEVGLKLAVTPEGRPDTDRETAESKLPEMVEVMEVEPELLWSTVSELGEALREKLAPAGGVIVRLMVVV